MKDYILLFGMSFGFGLLAFSKSILPITLINNWWIFGSVFSIGFITFLVLIKLKKETITDYNEYIFIPIRCIFSIGLTTVFSFIWLNNLYKEKVAIRVKVKSYFVSYEHIGGKFSNRVRCKSAFVINYKGQNKNITWNERLDDDLMKN